VTAKRGESLLWGISASSGIAEGKAYVLNRKKTKFAKRLLPRHLVDAEVARAKDAIERSKADLMRLKGSLAHDEIHEHVYILDAHLMILEDPMLLDSVVEIIQGQCKNAEWAFSTAFENYKRMFDSVNNEYLRERKSDFDYLLGWILSHLSGSMDEVLSDLKEKVIIVSHYLSPADTAQIDREKVIGFVTDIGGKTSHMAILARALKIPAVVGAEKATSEIAPGDTLIIDGMEGLVYINPSRETIKRYRERRARFGSLEKALLRDRDVPAETLDGRRIVLTANIEIAGSSLRPTSRWWKRRIPFSSTAPRASGSTGPSFCASSRARSPQKKSTFRCTRASSRNWRPARSRFGHSISARTSRPSSITWVSNPTPRSGSGPYAIASKRSTSSRPNCAGYSEQVPTGRRGSFSP